MAMPPTCTLEGVLAGNVAFLSEGKGGAEADKQ